MGDSNHDRHMERSYHMNDSEDMMVVEDDLQEGEETMLDEDGNVLYDHGRLHTGETDGRFSDASQPNLSTANAPSTLLGSATLPPANPDAASRTSSSGGAALAAAAGRPNSSASGYNTANSSNAGSASTSANPSSAPSTKERVDPATAKRKAIQAIMQDSSLSEREKGLRIQQLMDGRPSAAIAASSPSFGGANGQIGDMIQGVQRTSQAGTSTNSSAVSSSHGAIQGVISSTPNGDNVGMNTTGVNGGSNENMACVHYDRKCFIVAPCCNGVFGCRVCHDEMVSHGPMDRFAMREVVCKDCRTKQSAKTNNCINCGVQFAEYHCARCNLWMPKSKQPFHCEGCGFCRVGGREAYRHCDQCCMCISRAVFDVHNCMKDKYKNNCPVCREDMFSSRQSPQDLPCGHAIHAHCFRKLAGFDYRCPICKKTVVSQSSMAAAWAARARDIELQPMPPDLTRVVNIMCNDCETKSERRNWHFLGVQCPNCSSFNTAVENLVCQNANGSGGGGSGGGSGRLPDASPSV